MAIIHHLPQLKSLEIKPRLGLVRSSGQFSQCCLSSSKGEDAFRFTHFSLHYKDVLAASHGLLSSSDPTWRLQLFGALLLSSTPGDSMRLGLTFFGKEALIPVLVGVGGVVVVGVVVLV